MSEEHSPSSSKTNDEFDERKCICNGCNRTFSSVHSLRKHFFASHAECKSNVVVCNLCDETLANSADIDQHIVNVHMNLKDTATSDLYDDEKQTYWCEFCDKPFADERSFITHQKRLHAEFGETSTLDHSASSKSGEEVAPRQHVCGVCQKKFLNADILKEHTCQTFECFTCGQMFASPTELCSHSMKHHPKRERKLEFHCELCGESYQRRHALLRHLKQNHLSSYNRLNNPRLDSKLLEIAEGIIGQQGACDICSRVFNNTDGLKKHIFANHSADCKQCGKTFMNRMDGYNHFLNEHAHARLASKNVGGGTSNYKRPNKQSEPFATNEGSIKRAKVGEVDDSKKSQCRSTNEKVVEQRQDVVGGTSNYNRRSEQRCEPLTTNKGLITRQIVCGICNRTFIDAGGLKDHVFVSHPSKCERCVKKFANPTEVYNHVLKVHSGVTDVGELLTTNEGLITRPVPCGICNKMFIDGGALKNHIFTAHPSKCERCVKKFANAEEVYNHVLEVHLGQTTGRQQRSATNTDVVEERSAICTVCKAIVDVDKLKQHVQRYHSTKKYVIQQPPVVCTVCTAKFEEMSDLKEHMRQLHPKTQNKQVAPQPRSVCTVCAAKFDDVDDLKEHVYQCHPSVNRQIVPQTRGVCTACAATFDDFDILKDHVYHCPSVSAINKTVTEEPRVVCSVCGSKFINVDFLNQHVLKFHSAPANFCADCGLTLPSKIALRKHRSLMHDQSNQSKSGKSTSEYKIVGLVVPLSSVCVNPTFDEPNQCQQNVDANPKSRENVNELLNDPMLSDQTIACQPSGSAAIEVKVEPIDCDAVEQFQNSSVKVEQIEPDFERISN